MRSLLLLLIVACLTALAPSQARAEPPAGGIRWSALTAGQQTALSPLADLWPALRPEHQRKWIALARNFNRMSAEEQSTLQGRMTRWARLTNTERTKARQNYGEARRLSPDEKRARWKEYQALPTQERERLAKKRPKPPVSAAPALHPQPDSSFVRLSEPAPEPEPAPAAPEEISPAPPPPSHDSPAPSPLPPPGGPQPD
jgi:hypothetical protein